MPLHLYYKKLTKYTSISPTLTFVLLWMYIFFMCIINPAAHCYCFCFKWPIIFFSRHLYRDSPWFLVYLQSCTIITPKSQFYNIFITPKETYLSNPLPTQLQISVGLFHPWTTTDLLSIDLPFWIVHVNEIM